jgi:hypothetical protein
MLGIGEWTAHPQLAGIVQAGGLAEPAQAFVVAQRGRGEDPGPVPLGALLAHHAADVQRRLDQPGLVRRQIHPAHPLRRGLQAEAGHLGLQGLRPGLQPHEIGGAGGHQFQRGGGHPQGFGQAAQP